MLRLHSTIRRAILHVHSVIGLRMYGEWRGMSIIRRGVAHMRTCFSARIPRYRNSPQTCLGFHSASTSEEGNIAVRRLIMDPLSASSDAAAAASSSSSKKFTRGGPTEKPFLTGEMMTEKRQKTETLLQGVSDLTPLLDRMRNTSLDRTCPQCHRANHNNKIYCYDCLVAVGLPNENQLPHVELPIKLDILRHPKERKTKSTALHAEVLCGKDKVRTVELPQVDLLTGVIPARTLLLFPSPTALTLAEIPDLDQIERVVVVDSTWQQANQVLRSGLCQSLTRHVKLAQTHETSFWRHQTKGDDHLATIEAMYYFFRERFEVMHPEQEYDGRYDDMLYIFTGLLRLIEDNKKQPTTTEMRTRRRRAASGEEEETTQPSKEEEST